MAAWKVKGWNIAQVTRVAPLVILFSILLVSLNLMSVAIQNSDQVDSSYTGLFFINSIGLILLLGLIGLNLFKMAQQCRYRVPGSRLTVRMGFAFGMVAIVPVSIVYYYSMQFINSGIDNWFDIKIERAMEDAVLLSKASLDLQKRDRLRQTQSMMVELKKSQPGMLAINLDQLRSLYKASELTLLDGTGKVLAFSNVDPERLLPSVPRDGALFHIQQGNEYVGIERIRDEGNMHFRIIVPEKNNNVIVAEKSTMKILQALYPMPKNMDVLAASVENAIAHHRKLNYMHTELKDNFIATLSLVLLFSVLSAVWAAFYSAKRMVAPILDLVEGTRAVSAGIYDKQLISNRKDDLGGLVQAFNDMTRRLAQARSESQRAQQKVESQRAYLEVVLGHLSSGVITFDMDLRLRTFNPAASMILGIDLIVFRRCSIAKMVKAHPDYSNLLWLLQEHMSTSKSEWSDQVELFASGKRQVLLCRATALPDGTGIQSGYVVVFEDVTNLIQAQRDSAWGEVARRLAHEIKNPLTPIQLSAERLRRKLLPTLIEQDALMLEKSINTIINQVAAMKTMVNAFSEYAKTPQMNPEPLDLNHLLEDVIELYREKKDVEIELKLVAQPIYINADAIKLRQVIHNLVKNAIEALDGIEHSNVLISTVCTDKENCQFVELNIEDNGCGFSDVVINHVFEPYMTTKIKGTGLGLAIVKKIIEEHGGMISAENLTGGAKVLIRLPMISHS